MSKLRKMVEHALAPAAEEKTQAEQDENFERVAAIQASPDAVVKEDGGIAKCEICGLYTMSERWIQHHGNNYHICENHIRKLNIDKLGF